MATDLYSILGVSREASADEIKAAYRKLARQYHPDVNPDDPSAEEKFKEIGSAYAVLSDPDKRAQYDRFGTTEEMPQDFFQGGGGAGFGDIFDMFFGGANGGRGGSRRQGWNGGDIETYVNVSLEEVLTGADRQVKVRRNVVCDSCEGTGGEGGAKPETCAECKGQGSTWRVVSTFLGQVRTQTPCGTCGGTGETIKSPCNKCRGKKQIVSDVMISTKIPVGIENGATIQMTGKGHEGLGGGHPGDLYVGLSITADKRFEREGKNLYTSAEITFAQATIGDTVVIEGLDGDYDLEIPHGTQPGEILAVRGAGLPPLHGGKRGDIFTQIKVRVPKKLSEGQKVAVIELAQAFDEPIPKGTESGGLLGGLFKKKK
ncbi:MAG: molecular chaperone DnaJ [Fimbriimonadaceae bacterium]